MQADMKTLHKHLVAKHVMYQYNHNKPMSVSAAAQLLSNTLYYKRFFPYYTFNLCAGLDSEGEGVRVHVSGVRVCRFAVQRHVAEEDWKMETPFVILLMAQDPVHDFGSTYLYCLTVMENDVV
jgi:hypothetical protein